MKKFFKQCSAVFLFTAICQNALADEYMIPEDEMMVAPGVLKSPAIPPVMRNDNSSSALPPGMSPEGFNGQVPPPPGEENMGSGHITPSQLGLVRPNWYIDFSAGGNFNQAMSVTGSSLTTNDLKTDAGYTFSGALGYRPSDNRTFWHYTRFELEAAHRFSDVDDDGILPKSGSDGTIKTSTLMANAYYDFHNSLPITPYVGLGFGFSRMKLQDITRYQLTDAVDYSPAYQVLAGLSYKTGQEAVTELHLGYRYFDAINDYSFTDIVNSTKVKVNNESHNVEGGVRLYF